MNAKFSSGKNWVITPDGYTLNLDFVAKVEVGTNVGVDDMVLYFILGSQGYTATSGSNAIVQHTYANNAAALVALAEIQDILLGAGKAIDMR